MRIITSFEQFIPVLSKSQLLSNILVEQYHEIFSFLDATIKYFEKDEFLQRLDEPFLYSGIVLEGTVEGSFISESFNKISINQFTQGRSFGEALASIQAPHSPIQLKALTNCTVMLLNLTKLLTHTDCDFPFHRQLSANLIKVLASQNVFSNLKLRISNQKSLRDRIVMYFHSLHADKEGFILVPFTQTALAEFLGVNRSALSRELSNMQQENLILVEGKKIKLML